MTAANVIPFPASAPLSGSTGNVRADVRGACLEETTMQQNNLALRLAWDAGQEEADEAILEQARAVIQRRFERNGRIASPAEVQEYFVMRLALLRHEEFHVMYLDQKHRIIQTEMLFRGTLDHAEVHPRLVAQRALELNAAAIIAAHSHPSGDPTPSGCDRAITARLRDALAYFDIRVVDHIVVGGTESVSLAAKGWV